MFVSLLSLCPAIHLPNLGCSLITFAQIAFNMTYVCQTSQTRLPHHVSQKFQVPFFLPFFSKVPDCSNVQCIVFSASLLQNSNSAVSGLLLIWEEIVLLRWRRIDIAQQFRTLSFLTTEILLFLQILFRFRKASLAILICLQISVSYFSLSVKTLVWIQI